MVKRFKNGSIHAKIDNDLFCDYESNLVNLLWDLESVDCDIFGDEFCLSNYEMGIYLYSYYSDKKYLLPYSEVEEWKNGKTLILHPETLDEWDREILEAEYDIA